MQVMTIASYCLDRLRVFPVAITALSRDFTAPNGVKKAGSVTGRFDRLLITARAVAGKAGLILSRPAADLARKG